MVGACVEQRVPNTGPEQVGDTASLTLPEGPRILPKQNGLVHKSGAAYVGVEPQMTSAATASAQAPISSSILLNPQRAASVRFAATREAKSTSMFSDLGQPSSLRVKATPAVLTGDHVKVLSFSTATAPQFVNPSVARPRPQGSLPSSPIGNVSGSQTFEAIARTQVG